MAAEIGIRIAILFASASRRNLQDADRAVNSFQKSLSGLAGQAGKIGKSLTDVGSAISGVGRTLTFTVTGPIVAATGALVNAGIQFEDAFAGVSKTIDGVTDDSHELTEAGKELRDTLIELSRTIPVSPNTLADLGQLAGQFGANAEEAGVLVEVLAKLQVTTDLVGESAQQSFAQTASVAGLAIDEYERFASSIVRLGNIMPTTESRIVAFSQRIIGTATALGISLDAVVAWGAAVTASGIQAETGATALRKAFMEMALAATTATDGVVDNTAAMADAAQKAGDLQRELDIARQRQNEFTDATRESTRMAQEFRVDKINRELAEQTELLEGLEALHGKVFQGGSEELQKFAEVATNALNTSGMELEEFAARFGPAIQEALADGIISAEEFAAVFKEDASGALQLFIEGLSGLDATTQIAALDALGLGAQRVGATLQNLAANTGLLDTALLESAEAWQTATALQEEAEKRFNTVKSQIQLVKNELTALGIRIFDLVKDDLAALIDSVADLISSFARLGDKTDDTSTVGLSNFINKVREVVDWIASLDDGVKRNILRFIAFAAAVGPVLMVVGTLISFVGTIITGIGALSGVISSVVGWFSAAQAAIGVFAAAIGLTVGQVVLIVAAIAGLIALIITAIGPENIFQFIKDIADEIPGILEDVKGAIQDVIDTMEGLLSGDLSFSGVVGGQTGSNLDVAAGGAEKAAGIAVSIIPEIDFEKMKEGIANALGGIATFFAPIGAAISGFFSTLVENITGVWAGLVANINFDEIQTIVDLIKDSLASSLEELKTAWENLQPALEIARETFISLLPFLNEIFKLVGIVIVAAIAVFAAAILAAVVIIVALINVITRVIGVIASWISLIANAAQTFMGLLVNAIALVVASINFMAEVFKGNYEAAQEWFDIIVGILDQMKADFAVFVGDVLAFLVDLVAEVAELLGFTEAAEKMREFADKIIEFAEEIYHKLVGGSIFPDLRDDIVEVFGQLVVDAVAKFGELASKITDKAGEIGGKVKDALSGLFSGGGKESDGIDIGISDAAVNAIKEAVSGVKKEIESLPMALTMALEQFNMFGVGVSAVLMVIQTNVAATWANMLLGFTTMTMQMLMQWTLFSTAFTMSMIAMFTTATEIITTFDAQYTATTMKMRQTWEDFTQFFLQSLGMMNDNLSITAARQLELAHAIEGASFIATEAIRMLNGAFTELAVIATEVAAIVCESAAAIAECAEIVEEAWTNSPTLTIQHPFEKFMRFMDGFGTDMASQIEAGLLPLLATGILDGTAPSATNITNDNRSVEANVFGANSQLNEEQLAFQLYEILLRRQGGGTF